MSSTFYFIKFFPSSFVNIYLFCRAKIVDEEGLFKEKELDSLKKKITEVEKWRDDKLVEQEKTPLAEMPKLTVSMIKSKVGYFEC